jgi:hypothetical protein
MIRVFAVACALSCLAASAWAQAQSAPGTQTTTPATPADKKPAPKARTSAKPAEPAQTGRCDIGVIPVAGNQFAVQKSGLTAFGNEYTRVTFDDWGFDDLVVARVRAAAPGNAVQRIIYAREELRRTKPAPLFYDQDSDVRDFVRQITAGINCKRYLVVHSFGSQITDRTQRVNGMGIVYLSSPIKSRAYLFALTCIRIYDGHSFETIKQGAASTGDEPLMSHLLRFTPFR